MSDDREWVASTIGGKVTHFEQATAGRSRATWLVEVDVGGAPVRLVLRRDTGDGPLSGTELSLERESHVYRALGSSGVPIPKLRGVAPDGRALLVERVDGTEDLASVTDRAERARVMDSFLQSVARLHRVDPSTLDLPGFARPSAPADHALADLQLWRRIFDEHVARAAPLVRLAFRWLGSNPPRVVEQTVLCHGDLGPGNFLFQDGRVTALLDWEFAHLGDPMDDLAWLTVRAAQVADLGDLRVELARYSELTGWNVDGGRVRYYQLFVLVRMAVACLVALDKRKGGMDASTYFMLLPMLERQISTLLAEQLGVALEPAAAPVPGRAAERAEILEVLSTDLGSALMPELQTAAARSRAFGMAMLLAHLQSDAQLGATLDQAELDDLAMVLDTPPVDVRAGTAALDRLVAEVPDQKFADLVPYFSRHADRRLATWPMVAAIANKPLPGVDEA